MNRRDLIRRLLEVAPGARQLRDKVVETASMWGTRAKGLVAREVNLRLSWKEDESRVPITVEDGLEYLTGAEIEALLDTAAWDSLERAASDQGSFDEIASEFLPHLLKVLSSTTMFKPIKESDAGDPGQSVERREISDPLGVYRPLNNQITLFWPRIAAVAGSLQSANEDLTKVVILHEAVHAFSHCGLDNVGSQWDTEQFLNEDTYVIEGVAQYYTCLVLQHLPDEIATFDAFRALLQRQTLEYTDFIHWFGISADAWRQRRASAAKRLSTGVGTADLSALDDLPLYSEAVRSVLMDARRSGIGKYGVFMNKLRHRGGTSSYRSGRYAETTVAGLQELNRRLCSQLWNMTTEDGEPTALSPRLIQPQKRDDSVRLSEQEARFLYTSLLNEVSFYYSVETPTQQCYNFSGPIASQGLSARTDVTLFLYDDDQFNRVANVEFKAGNPEVCAIRKDVEKLVTESGIVGCWFHILDNADSGTLKALFEKFKDAFTPWAGIGPEHQRNKEVTVVFFFCVLRCKWACCKVMRWVPQLGTLNQAADAFFDIDYRVINGKIELAAFNDWEEIVS